MKKQKKYALLSLSVATIVSLTGCGGGSGDSSNPQSSATGTGYYVDSAVAGVSYTCGSQTGVTDENGKFVFEKGKNCTFSVAGIPLRSVPADDLADNAKIVETDVKVAKFLQSIDTDGNLTNGIQITDKVIDVLTKALKDNNITSVQDVDTQLTTVVEEVKQQVPDFKGEVKTDEEVMQHLTHTQTSVLKELLGGKTLYAVGYGSDGYHAAGSVEFDKELTTMHYKGIWNDPTDDETDHIKVDGNKLVWLSDNSYTVVGANKGDYIEVTDYKADGSFDGKTRIYFDKTKAEAYFNSLKSSMNGDGGSSSSSNGYSAEYLKNYFSGKTFYNKWCGNVNTMIFSQDGSSMTNGDGTHSMNYTDGKLVDDIGDHYIDEITNSYVKGHDSHGTFMLYLSRSDAEAAVSESCENGSGSSSSDAQNFTAEMLSANPWYRIEYTDSEAYCNGKFTFDSNGNLTVSWSENGTIQSETGSYSIVDGKVVTVHNGKKETETLMSKDATTLTVEKIARDSQTDEYLHTMNIKYFKNRQDAINFGNSYGVDCNNELP